MEMKLAKTKKGQALAFAVLLVLMLPIFVVGIYNRPSVDDYDYSRNVHSVVQAGDASVGDVLRTAWETDVEYYHAWQGLYTSAFVLALQPGVFGEAWYALSPLIVTAVIFAALWGSAHILQKRLLKQKLLPDTLLALFFTFVIVEQIPYPNQGIYWFNGAMNYTPYCLLAFWVQMLVLEAWKAEKPAAKYGALAGAVVLSFLISGGNHVTTALNILMLCLFTLVLALQKKVWALPPLAAALLGFVIMYTAPGTQVRAGQYAKQGLISSGLLALFQGVKSIFGWVTLGYLCYLLLLAPLAYQIAKQNRLALRYRWPLLPLAASYALVSAMWFVPKYAMGMFGAGRIENVVWIAFLVLSFADMIYLFGWAQRAFTGQLCLHSEKRLSRFAVPLACACCLLGILGASNGGNCEYSTSVEGLVELAIGNVQTYGRECDVRIAQYKDASLAEAAVKPFTVRSTLLFVDDLSTDPTVWPNNSVSDYYGKPIYLREAAENTEQEKTS